MQIKFRDATLEDLTTVVEIYNSTIPSRMVTADAELVTIESRINWLNEHSAGKRPLWVIENNERVIGWVSFQDFYGRPAYDATAEISIYLDKDYRGKGLGRSVLEHCIDSCTSMGIKTLVGFIFQHNEPSIKLFTQLGFEDWGTLPNIAMLDNIERTLKIFGKRISK